MRAKLSTTADGTYTGFAPPGPIASDFLNDQYAGPVEQAQAVPRRSGSNLHRQALQRADRPTQAVTADLRGEGLLHDARNLVSAIGLYCDLLSMPGVLKPEHKQYPEELRLLGTRSRVLIEHLLRTLVSQNLSLQETTLDERIAPPAFPADLADRRSPGAQTNSYTPESGARVRAVSLRATVERCSGLLSRVANGRPIKVIYGAAADVPVCVSEEAIERILVNLVRNAAQALDKQSSTVLEDADTARHASHADQHSTDLPHRRHRRTATSPLPGSRSPIHISVGPLLDRIGEARSWPFQHVRLVVEDSGCGMDPKQLHSLIFDPMACSRGTHGIGFRVVRELVAASNGDLRAASTPGIGTRVQIEWPVVATPTAEKLGDFMQSKCESGNPLTHQISARKHRLIPPATQPSVATEARPGVN